MPLGKIEPFKNLAGYKPKDRKVEPANKTEKPDSRDKRQSANNLGQKVDIEA